MAYNITLSKSAIRFLEKINEPFYSRIKEAIYNLGENPRPQGSLKLKNRDGFRIRVGDYRIIYNILEDIVTVNIINLGHRRNIYD